jgi:hypothetical protein
VRDGKNRVLAPDQSPHDRQPCDRVPQPTAPYESLADQVVLRIARKLLRKAPRASPRRRDCRLLVDHRKRLVS